MTYWQGYDAIEPLDTAGRIELAVAKVSHLLFNVHRDSNVSEPRTLADELPQWGKAYRDEVAADDKPAAMTPDQVRASFKRYRDQQHGRS